MSQRKSGYIRRASDSYHTPIWPTQLVLRAEGFGPGVGVYDPCCGAGHILRAAMSLGCPAAGADILGGLYAKRNFLEDSEIPFGWDVVSNPPFGIAVQIIEHALALTREFLGKVVMLLRVDFDSGKTRRHIFEDHPAFVCEYKLTSRIRWANLEQKDDGPSQNHSWFVWDWANPRPPGAIPGKRYLHREAA